MLLVSKTRRPRRRTERERPIPTLVVGALVVVALVVVSYIGLRTYNGVIGRDYQTVYASVPQVGNLVTHDQVRVAGVRVGQVLSVGLGPDRRPRLELQIEPDVKLPADTRVVMRASGLLGGRYVELIPGESKEPLRDGAVIHGDERSSYAYGLGEALDTLDEPTRKALSRSVGALGEGLAGRGKRAGEAMTEAADHARPFSELAREILRREGGAGRLLPALASAVRPLDAERGAIAELTGTAADGLEPIVEQRDALQATLRDAPPAMRALRPGLVGGSRLLRAAQAVTHAANRTLPPAPAALRSTTALLRDSHRPLRQAKRVVDAAEPAVPAVLRLADAAEPVLDPLRDLLADLRPPLRELDRFSCDIINFGVVMRSMTGYTQPGPEGPLGQAMAFRLQVVAPLTTDIVGIKDPIGMLRREPPEPCMYLAKPYPQIIPGSEEGAR